MKKRNLLLVLTLACLACLCVGAVSMAAPAKTVLKMSHPVAANLNSDVHVFAMVFAEYVNRFGDNIEVKIYPNGQLGNERDQLEAMQLGTGADCCMDGTAIMGNFAKRMGVLDLPFLWKDYDQVHKVLDGPVGDALAADMEKLGIKVLAWGDSWGYRNVATSKIIKKPEDLKGLKVRVIQTETNIAAIDLLGANATPMAFGEVYTALQTGVLDGMEHCSAVILANKFNEVTKCITLTRHLFGPLALNMSVKSWNKLSDYNKQVVQAAAKVAAEYERSLAPIMEERAFDELKKLGMTVTKIDIAPFEKAAVKFQDDYAKKIGATDLLKTIRETK